MATLYEWCMLEGNRERGKLILEEFDEEKNASIGITVHNIPKSFKSKVHWVCKDCENKFIMAPMNRTGTNPHKNMGGCQICARKIVSNKLKATLLKESLYDWCIANDKKYLIDEYIGDDPIDKVSAHSGIKVKWKCRKCNHEWMAAPCHRTIGRGCPACNKIGTSFIEQFIYYSVKQIYPKTKNRVMINENGNKFELDIVIPEIKTAIEYSGEYWHSKPNRISKDTIKRDECKKNNIRLITIIETKNTAADIVNNQEDTYYIIRGYDSDDFGNIQQILTEIFGDIAKNIDIKKAKKLALEYSGSIPDVEKSLDFKYNNVGKEILPEYNDGLTAAKLYSHSHTRVNWKCSECGHIWNTRVADRVNYKTRCPKCKNNIWG